MLSWDRNHHHPHMTPVRLRGAPDADTLKITWTPRGPIDDTVRLLAIDAPERGEPLWRESRHFLISHAQSLSLALAIDYPPGPPRGHCNRLLAYAFVQGELLQTTLARRGFAVHLAKFGPTPRSPEIIAATDYARSHRLGIWSLPDHRLQHLP